MLEELREYAWRHRLSISQVIRDILQNVEKDVRFYQNWDDDIHGNSATVTVYVPDEQWTPVKDATYWARMSMSSIIRKGIRATLASDKQAA
jgi:hypothetical protein